MSMRNSLLLAAVAAVSLAPIGASAADTANVAATVTINYVANLTSSGTTTSWTLSEADYQLNTTAGDIQTASRTNASVSSLQIATNRNWKLQATAGAANFAFTPANATFDNPAYNKPSSDLEIRKAAGTYVALNGTTAVDIITGNRGGYGTSGNSFDVDFRLNSSLAADYPGVYTLTVTLAVVPAAF